jgi:hypothetical protein
VTVIALAAWAIVKLVLVAGVNVPSVAASVYPDPAVLIVHPEKMITPEDSACEQPETVAPLVPVPDVIPSVTVEESEMAVFP